MRHPFTRAIANRTIAQPPRIALGIVSAWIVLGSAALLCFPALRGSNAWFGWLPLWLVVMPAAEWLILRWRSVVDAVRAVVAGIRRRRRTRLSASRLVSKARPRRRHVRIRAGSMLTALRF